MSRPSGHAIVLASTSTYTFAKYAGSLRGSSTPVHSSWEKPTSPTVPSSKRSRRTWSRETATPATAGRYMPLTVLMLREGLNGDERLVCRARSQLARSSSVCSRAHLTTSASERASSAGENHAIRRHGSAGFRTVGVEMGDGMVALVRLHVDHDPVKRAYPRQLGNFPPLVATNCRPSLGRCLISCHCRLEEPEAFRSCSHARSVEVTPAGAAEQRQATR
jgi:hypothetical protein